MRLPWAREAEFVPPYLEDEWESDREIARREERLRDGEILEDEEMSGVSVTHWAPLRPRATREAPRTAGFYAVRRMPDEPWQVAEVIVGPEGDLWWATDACTPATRVADVRTQLYQWSEQALLLPQ